MSKLVFNITDIPEGQSQRRLTLEEDDLDLSPYTFTGGEIDLSFYRTLHFIRVDFEVHSEIELVCDRSLDPYIQPLDADYQVVFKVDVQEETETEEGAVRSFDFSSNTFSIKDEVRDTLLLKVPMQKIHPRYLDEQGLPEEFETKTFGESSEEDQEEMVDPRWEKLKKLKD